MNRRITAETASIIVAILRMLIELFRVDDGQERVVVVLDPAKVGAEEMERIVGLSRWHRVIGDENPGKGG